MRSYRGLVLVSGPALGIVLVIVALLHRPEAPPSPRKTAKPAPSKAAEPAPAEAVAAPAARTAPAPKPPEIVVAKTMDEARVMQTYQTFRTAVAGGNARVQAEIRRVLLRDEELALRVAESAVVRASNEPDREIAQKTLEALRR